MTSVTSVPFYDSINGLGITKVIYPKCNNVTKIYFWIICVSWMRVDRNTQIVSEPSGNQPGQFHSITHHIQPNTKS